VYQSAGLTFFADGTDQSPSSDEPSDEEMTTCGPVTLSQTTSDEDEEITQSDSITLTNSEKWGLRMELLNSGRPVNAILPTRPRYVTATVACQIQSASTNYTVSNTVQHVSTQGSKRKLVNANLTVAKSQIIPTHNTHNKRVRTDATDHQV